MLVERRYPLSKELLQRMLDMGLEVEKESAAALHLGSQLTLLHSKELASPGSNNSCYQILFSGRDDQRNMPKLHSEANSKRLLLSNSEGLHKGYDRFQSLLSQLEIHGAGVSTKDANQKFLRVFKSNVKGSTASSSSTQNVAFVSSKSQPIQWSTTGHEDLEQNMKLSRRNRLKMAGGHDLHEIKEGKLKGNQHGRRRDAWNSRNKARDNGRRLGKQEKPKALVTVDGEGLDTEENIRFMKIDLDDKTDVLTYHKKVLAEAEKEKEELNAKIEKWHSSFKGLTILLNSQKSVKDKTKLGSSDIEDSPVNDRYAEGMHAVPPPMTGIYIPSGPDKEIDDSQFTYGLKQSKPSESDARSSDFNSCESNSSEETLESMPEPVVNESNVVSQPKVWSDAPIIEEYESDSDDEHVSLPTKEQETPSFAFVNTVKHIKTPRQTVKEQNTCSQSPKPDKKDCSGLMSKKLGLGYGFTKKACFICGSFSHLIRDCDFYEKRMAKQAELNKRMCKGTGQRENRPA
ncbi:hypothetical protein Tco_0674626 [Tanacetum coccineum]